MPSSASRFDENSKAASSIRQWREYCAELLEDRRLLVEDLAALAQCAEEVESLAGNALRNNGATADATEAARSTKVGFQTYTYIKAMISIALGH